MINKKYDTVRTVPIPTLKIVETVEKDIDNNKALC